MKLLFCKNCGSIFNLDFHEKKCKCGNVKGRYVDDVKAIYSGNDAMPIGIDNFSFAGAVSNQPEDGKGKRFEAFVIPKKCDTFVREG